MFFHFYFLLINLLWRTWKTIEVYIFSAHYILMQNIEKHQTYTIDPEKNNLKGKVVIITGGGTGIGYEVTKRLLTAGAHVITASNDSEDTRRKLQEWTDAASPPGTFKCMHVNLLNMKSVKHFVDSFLKKRLPLHMLINNAAIMFPPYSVNSDGFESQFAVNYMSHFLLIQLLLPLLKKSGSKNDHSKILNTSSCLHYLGNIAMDDLQSHKRYSPYGSYEDSKLAVVLMTRYLHRQLIKTQSFVTVNSLHPGVCNTPLFKYVSWSQILQFLMRLFFKTPSQASDTYMYCLLSSDMANVGGKYIDNCKIKTPSALAQDPLLQEQLWLATIKLLAALKI